MNAPDSKIAAGNGRARLKALAQHGEVDVVILGAGINGAGLFRELTAQGLSCLIVDKADYGSGTSAAPSRLIHGGLKYLETGEFRLVAESTLERNLLLRNAPHYVQPLPTVIPIFSWTKGVWAALRTLFGSTRAPRSRGAALIKLGLSLYDFYGGRERVMPRHRMAGRARSLKDLPALTPRIVATGTYYDALITHPERLVLELITDGLALEADSAAGNYLVLEGQSEGRLAFRDTLTGETFTMRPRLVVNAAGPWIDQVNRTLAEPTRLIGGTKGSHILLDHPELVRLLKGQMLYFEADDGRICLVYPYLGRALVGSTDIRADDPDSVVCDADETNYLLESLRALLPRLSFDRDQIVYTYCGIRPLPASDASNPGLISRDHSVDVLEPAGERPFPILSLVGGKWTTFRGFAEETCDAVLKRLGRSRRTATRGMPIGGGAGFPVDAEARRRWLADEVRRTGLPQEQVETLLQRYGAGARRVSTFIASVSGDRPLVHAVSYSSGEIAYLASCEEVGHLADIVFRRTTLAVLGGVTRPLLADIAGIIAPILGWSDVQTREEISAVVERLNSRHGGRL
jgi:glycerol-3-phosphate dehydrogenase